MSIAEDITRLSDDKGISQDLIRKIVEEFLITAYEKTFHTADNAVVRFNEFDNEPMLFARKQIVEQSTDPVMEISLQEALSLNDDSEVGDELLIEVDPKEFDREAILSAKQRAKECLSDVQRDVLFSEFGDRVGKMVVGYIQREQEGDIYVDLGSTEGLLPKKYQSPREEYRTGDRIKAIICDVNTAQNELAIILSRANTDFVRRIFELEVPEVQEQIVEIHDIVREPGYRTKIAVRTNRPDVDPVSACVGARGARIHAIVKELEGERIDIASYSTDVTQFISNALSPARVEHVQVIDEKMKNALAIVNDDQLSFAIGKHGLNVRLANKLVGWNIDVKTRSQVNKMATSSETMKMVSQLFDVGSNDELDQEEEVTHVSELPDVTPALVLKLQDSRIEHISDLLMLNKAERAQLPGLDSDEVELLERVLSENVEVIESDAKNT